MASIRKIVRVTFKVLGAFLLLVLIAMIPFSLVISHDSACPETPALAAGATSMRAMVHRCYGEADVLKLENIEKPAVGDDEVLVRVHASAVNPLDFHYLHGTPYILRLEAGIGAPTNPRAGVDYAGTVEAVGRNVTRFHPGDAVFGGRTGAFADYVTAREDRAIAAKPDNVSFTEAASVPIAALTALQAVRDKGHVRAGQKVLINGSSGGVGTFAVQIAKSFGAEVTGVCSTKNLDLVRSIGADHVIDYTKEDFTKGDGRYDVIVDTVGTHGLFEYARVMQPNGIYVMVGGQVGKWLSPFDMLAQVILVRPFVSQKITMMLAEFNPRDMAVLADLLKTGKVKPVIDRTYKLEELPEAIRYLEKGHARGKVVIDVAGGSSSQVRVSDHP
jgi:NADPH:quinone reductase-like Zn-dependent oxidoreductase